MNPSVSIRAAGPADADALGRLHMAVWRATYEGMAPQALFDALEDRRGPPYWQADLARIAEGGTGGALLAEEGGRVVALLRHGPASQPELGEGGEIKHLYVAQDCAGRGIGARMLEAGLAELAGAGHRRAVLAVVAQNTRAVAFYRAHGGREVGRFRDAGPLWRSENLIMEWDLG